MNQLFQDPDFLRIYHSADKEWPGYKVPDNQNASLPLLVSEIYRLIPYIGSEYVHFHPKNMPDVMIDKVEIIGLVTSKIETMKYTSYTVDDSTGAIPVLCKKREKNQDGLTTNNESGPEPSLGLAPYEKHIQDLWNHARYDKLSDNEIALYDYVHVIGFCAMTFRNEKDMSELTDEDIRLGRLFFLGTNMRQISEADHNNMMKSLITDVVKKRYMKSNS